MNEIYIYCKKKDICSELEMLNCIFPININVHDFPFLLQFYIHFISEFTMMNCLFSISFYADKKNVTAVSVLSDGKFLLEIKQLPSGFAIHVEVDYLFIATGSNRQVVINN
jgi:hypothetical protein